eukprot:5688579-Pleurochrysis_carterae.AAC.6
MLLPTPGDRRCRIAEGGGSLRRFFHGALSARLEIHGNHRLHACIIRQRDHLSRAIGRLAGKVSCSTPAVAICALDRTSARALECAQDGKCKFAIENATRTRIIIADSRVHILGSFSRIKVREGGSQCVSLVSKPYYARPMAGCCRTLAACCGWTQVARDAICALILGSPISKVYSNLRSTAGRLSQKI